MIKLIATLALLISTTVCAQTINLTKTNFVSITDEINDMTTAVASQELMQKCAQFPGKSIYLVLYSPGGSVPAGKAFIDFVNGLPCKVHSIALFAASMAYQIFENLGDRYIVDSSVLMSHRASISGIGGQIPGELYSRIKHLNDMVTEVDIKTAKRIGISLEQYKKDIHDELWMTAGVAMATNHADKIVTVRCDKSLTGTKTMEIDTMFGPVLVKMSECPIILGPLEIMRKPEGVSEKIDEEISNFFNPFKARTGYEY